MHILKSQTRGITQQAGSTLIEVLIAFFVFAIGLQGVLILQYQSIKDNFDSAQRSQGVWLAEELINRVRANTAGREAGDYDFSTTDIACGSAPPSCADDTPSATASACTSSDMASYDKWSAICDLGRDLIDLEVTLSCVGADSDPGDPFLCSPGTDFTLEVSWQSKSVADNPDQISDVSDTLKTQIFRQVFRP